jgi:hypothetical protein
MHWHVEAGDPTKQDILLNKLVCATYDVTMSEQMRDNAMHCHCLLPCMCNVSSQNGI